MRAALSGTTALVMTAGVVVAVGEMLRQVSPGPALAWLVALTTIGHAVAAAWTARTGPPRREHLARSGAWASGTLVLATLALTSPGLCGRLLALLAVLTLAGVALDHRGGRRSP